jgi:hypothetical protein
VLLVIEQKSKRILMKGIIGERRIGFRVHSQGALDHVYLSLPIQNKFAKVVI